jgi:hypothetical protein
MTRYLYTFDPRDLSIHVYIWTYVMRRIGGYHIANTNTNHNTTHLIWRRSTHQSHLSHNPASALVATPRPDCVAESAPRGLDVKVKGPHVCAVHVVPELETFPARLGKLRTEHPGLVARLLRGRCLDEHVVPYRVDNCSDILNLVCTFKCPDVNIGFLNTWSNYIIMRLHAYFSFSLLYWLTLNIKNWMHFY